MTAEQQVTRDQLILTIVQTPAGDKAPAGSPVVCVASVEWKNPSGAVVPWDPGKIRMRYGASQRSTGAGPFLFRPSYTKQTLVVQVDLWSERRGEWVSTTIYKQDITAYCAVDMGDWLSREEKHVVATLFSEGGSDAANMSRDELTRVMWCIQHRVDLLRSLETAAARDPRDEVARRRLKFARGRGWGRGGTYAAVLTKAQFSGIDTDQYKLALEPAQKISSEIECKRLAMTIDVVFGVMTGTIADPDAGRGNANEPGCFYYMTKTRFAENVAWNAANPDKDPKLAPDWEKLPTRATDKHFYWGIEPSGPFGP